MSNTVESIKPKEGKKAPELSASDLGNEEIKPDKFGDYLRAARVYAEKKKPSLSLRNKERCDNAIGYLRSAWHNWAKLLEAEANGE